MDPLQRQFTTIIERYGYGKCGDQRWLRALLRDLLPAAPSQINALADAASENIPSELSQMRNDAHSILKHAQLKQRLIDNRGWKDELANWTIAAWFSAISSSSENGKSFSLKCPACGLLRSFTGGVIGEVVPCGNASCDANLRVFSEGKCVSLESRIEDQSNPSVIVATDGSGHFNSLAEALRKTPDGVCITLRGGPFEGGFVITKPTVINGEDPAQRVVIRTSSGTCFQVRSGSLRFENLNIETQITATGARKPALEVAGGEAEFANCHFGSSSGEAIRVYGGGCRARFNDCSFHSERGGAVVVFDRAECSFARCSIADTRGTALSIDAGANVRLRACTIERTGASGIVSRKSDLLLDHCRISGSKDWGIDISGGTFEIMRSIVTANQTRGIWIRSNASGRIEGCDLRGNRRGTISAASDCSVSLTDNMED